MSKTVTIPTDGMNPFVVISNGVKYVYTPGETVTVPDGVALEIEEYKRWREKYYATTQPPFDDDDAGGGSGITDAEKTLILNLFRNAAYTANVSATFAQLEALWSGSGDEGGEGGGNEGGETPDIPDEPDIPEVTLTSISATYSGGEVEVGTDVSKLNGITVVAKYSDGTTASVSGYTLSGTITEGANTITVHYEGLTTTFTVTGVAAPEIYTVSYNLTDVTADTNASSVTEGDNLTIVLSCAENYLISSVVVTMGGVDVTSTVYGGGIITLTNITGDVVITATAEEVKFVETTAEFAITTGSIYADGTTDNKLASINNWNFIMTPQSAAEDSTVHIKLTSKATDGNFIYVGAAKSGTAVFTHITAKDIYHAVAVKTSQWAAGVCNELDYTVPAGYHLAITKGSNIEAVITGDFVTYDLENEYEFVTATPSGNWDMMKKDGTKLATIGGTKYMTSTPFSEETTVRIVAYNTTDAEIGTGMGFYTIVAAHCDGATAVGNDVNAINVPQGAGNCVHKANSEIATIEYIIPAGHYLVTTVPPSCMFVKKIS